MTLAAGQQIKSNYEPKEGDVILTSYPKFAYLVYRSGSTFRVKRVSTKKHKVESYNKSDFPFSDFMEPNSIYDDTTYTYLGNIKENPSLIKEDK